MSVATISSEGTKDLVSVTIPTFRGEEFISQALEAVGAQTYPHWEAIVVEDASTGPTQSIVERFAERHPNHRVEFSRNARNLGCGGARNVTFSKARGEFIAMLDADDRWLPGYLEAAVDGLKTSGKDIAYASTVMFDDRSNLLLGVWGPQQCELADFPQSLFGRSYLTPSATLLRRQTLVDVGPWETGLGYCDDYCYWMRCVAAGKSFHHVGGLHCLYRKNHSGAITRRLCATIEEMATVAERFAKLSCMRPLTSRLYVSNLYLVAARLHATSDRTCDPSADPTRAARMLFKAWQYWPRRVHRLFQAGALGAVYAFRRRGGGATVDVRVDDAPTQLAA